MRYVIYCLKTIERVFSTNQWANMVNYICLLPHAPTAMRWKMKRTKRLISTLLIVLLLSGMLAAQATAANPQRIMLSWTGDSATTMTITWVGDSETPAVRYSPDKTLADALEVTGTPAPNKSAIDNDGVRMTATLTGLIPATTYWYVVGSDGNWSEAKSFTTAEQGTESFSFMYFGDIQVANSAATEFAAWGKLANGAYERNPAAAFALQGGDIVESGINTEQWAMFTENASDVLSRIPFMPTNGNHESNFLSGKPELYLDTFTLPQNGPEGFKEEFYSFDYGNAHITILNDWVFSGEQRLTEEQLSELDAWVESDLVSSAAPWKIVVTHVPIYAIHSDTTANRAREHWAPLFEKYGVSLVLVGHQHVYSRLKPLTDGEVDYENGVTYIMGNSGQKHYSSADETLAERTIYNTTNYQIISIDGRTATVQTYDSGGNELDYTALTPRTIGSITRAEYIAALYRAAGSPEASLASPFSDVAEDSQYAEAIAWASEIGIVNGVGGGMFDPITNIRAEHVSLVLARLGGNK